MNAGGGWGGGGGILFLNFATARFSSRSEAEVAGRGGKIEGRAVGWACVALFFSM
jgi:hypothetical protein